MQKYTTDVDEKTAYSKPTLSVGGGVVQLTRGGSGDQPEGKNIVWPIFCSLPSRPRD